MSRDIWFVFGIIFAMIPIIVVAVIAVIYPSGRVTQIELVTSSHSPPALIDSSAGGSTGESGQALPANTPPAPG
jgi:hypothetical protein